MVNPFISPAVLSFCPGILGLEKGIERTIGPIRNAAYVEIETFIIENLLVAMEAGVLAPCPVYANIKRFDPRPFRNRVSWITGGYPCQPFSHAGKRVGAADPRHLWPFIFGALFTIRPPVVFFENVSGHLTCGYDIVRRDLRALGYAVKEGIYSAEEVDAPHLRKRLFILGLLADRAGGDGRGANWSRWWDEFTNYRRQLAYPESNGDRRGSAEVRGQERGQDGQLYAESGYAGEKLDDTNGSGLLGRREHESFSTGVAGRPAATGPIACAGEDRRPGIVENNRIEASELEYTELQREQWRHAAGMGRLEEPFPARPGERQRGWEHTRTIESRLGCTVDGYNFREDLLRALGNSVVEQQSAFALNDLLNQHFDI